MKEIAAIVLIVTPDGIPLVRDPSKPDPLFWKLPGGHGKAGEDARACAVREVREETGIDLSNAAMETVAEIDRGNHILSVFYADLPDLPSDFIHKQGEEGEEVCLFTPREIFGMRDFMSSHLVLIAGTLSKIIVKQHA